MPLMSNTIDVIAYFIIAVLGVTLFAKSLLERHDPNSDVDFYMAMFLTLVVFGRALSLVLR